MKDIQDMDKRTRYWYEKGIDDALEFISDMLPNEEGKSFDHAIRAMKKQLLRKYDLIERIKRGEYQNG